MAGAEGAVVAGAVGGATRRESLQQSFASGPSLGSIKSQKGTEETCVVLRLFIVRFSTKHRRGAHADTPP